MPALSVGGDVLGVGILSANQFKEKTSKNYRL
jgi:hypothetical protein